MFNKHTSFPVLLAAKTKQESELIIRYLTQERTEEFNVIAYIDWAEGHFVDYCIIYGNRLKLLKDPKRLLSYLCIKRHIIKA